MKIKKTYIKPDIEVHFVDQVINLQIASDYPLPPMTNKDTEPELKSAPSSEYPFGGDKPDFSNM
ncbi:hypothetical protein [Carboxylicivirga sp. M1479]|uniref:hypothetical protein n=1 Tax=Carboxylicivirga sp. M1479 TaxID=2594476 RepID=UPI00117846B1|nr:hypothetical protein [Carboxylicivirga sp. M1479]TRX63006.1 hypothetical protein FNN09_19175 [Carboxylicivirga sp. M1479]